MVGLESGQDSLDKVFLNNLRTGCDEDVLGGNDDFENDLPIFEGIGERFIVGPAFHLADSRQNVFV